MPKHALKINGKFAKAQPVTTLKLIADNHTHIVYTGLSEAYVYFNKALFNDTLRHCLITLQRKKSSRGYYQSGKFNDLVTGNKIDEIALNPSAFLNRTNEQILSTLAHEMCHLWQCQYGKPSRGGYHNKEWANKMKEIGLQPSHTGEIGGNETGPKITHYIIDNGLFAIEVAKFLASATFKLYPDVEKQTKEKKASNASKTKFSCPSCDANAWAKPTAKLMCGDCELPMECF